MVLGDSDSSVLYAGCQQKHAEVTGLYQLWRQKILDYKAELAKKEQESGHSR